jgi:cell division protease FtsH
MRSEENVKSNANLNPNPNGGAGPRPALWYWVLIPLIVVTAFSFFDNQRLQPLAYSDFKKLLNAGEVSDLVIADDTIKGTLSAAGVNKITSNKNTQEFKCAQGKECQFSTVRVTDPDLINDLTASGVRYAGQVKGDWLSNLLSWVIPFIFFFWVWGMIARRSGISSGLLFDIGKSKARVYVAHKTGVTFADVAGIDEAKEELMEIVQFLKNPQQYRRLGGKIPKGILIVGPPGTGKTLLAKAVAGEAGVPFFSISGSEFVEMFVGVGAARVRDLFSQAEQKAPSIIFIDELDALGKARGVAGVVGGYNEQEQTLNQLLVEMDGFDTNKGVIILGATNRPEILDAALLRPGRFDRHIALDRPDLKGREKILKVHAAQVNFSPDVNMSVVAARTAGFAGADLANLINEAALLAGRRNKNQVEMSDVNEAIDRIVAGLEKKTRVMNQVEKQTVAYHEAGHALTAECRRYADRVNKISIIPRGIAALGYTQQLPTEDRYLLKKAELLDRLDVLLGGRVAEEVVFGDVSTGAQNDLQLATDMARHMVTQYGMSERLGLATFEQSPTPLNIQQPGMSQKKEYSEYTARTIDAEIGDLLDKAHARVRETLISKRELLEALAQALLKNETLDRAALDALKKTYESESIRRVGSTG